MVSTKAECEFRWRPAICIMRMGCKETDITPENYNVQCNSRTFVEEQVGYSDESGEDSAPEEPLNSSADEVSILKRLGLQREFYTEKEVESAFIHLSLAFKSDMFTLKQRLEVEERARDAAEENIRKELEGCKIILQKLKTVCFDGQRLEILKQLEWNLQILEGSISRVANKSEVLGAVHQEARVSQSVQLMIEHVENLKSVHAKEYAELQEMKKIIQQNSRNRQFGDIRDDADFQTKHQMMRTIHQSTARRRVSIAVIPKQLMTFHILDSKIADSEDHRMDYNSPMISRQNGRLFNSRLQNPQEDSAENHVQCTSSDSSLQMLSCGSSEKEDDEISVHGQNQEEKIGIITESETLNSEATETENETEDGDEWISDTTSESSLTLERLPPSSGISCLLQNYQMILTSVALTLIVAWLLQPFSLGVWH
ncbi:inositol 1,4,5-triphosphate receptor associated 2 [Carcharodon carcharias]|uniref:inositol 1,4,5-triphosphate receptor associated 2 n=1 Tax=Carcharodon carcharias TaxID=13397 RepID=UPI001B7F428C|nr:inositol 1,4,5-triphosphate receptor associated 2 [Carcharodon carcharias]